jgi:hypothetical protein
MKIKLKKNMSFGFGWALPTLPPLTSRHCWKQYLFFDVIDQFYIYQNSIELHIIYGVAFGLFDFRKRQYRASKNITSLN